MKKSSVDHMNRIVYQIGTFFSVIVTSIFYLCEKK